MPPLYLYAALDVSSLLTSIGGFILSNFGGLLVALAVAGLFALPPVRRLVSTAARAYQLQRVLHDVYAVWAPRARQTPSPLDDLACELVAGVEKQMGELGRELTAKERAALEAKARARIVDGIPEAIAAASNAAIAAEQAGR